MGLPIFIAAARRLLHLRERERAEEVGRQGSTRRTPVRAAKAAKPKRKTH